MIVQCGKADKESILAYIGSGYSSCLYLYLDLLQYGMASDFIDVYVQKENHDIQAVLLKYYSCLHVYARENNFNAEELAAFFSANQFTMLYCPAETAKRVYMAFSPEMKKKAAITKGWVARIESVDHAPCGLAAPARKQDFDQIIRLIYEDADIGRSYKLDELAKQLEERNREGYARNLVIKNGDMVIAHVCTNAELNGISVVAELLVREEYRKKGFASEIMREICSQLLAEGKEVYSFYYTEESRTLHKHMGFHEVCAWAKIVIA